MQNPLTDVLLLAILALNALPSQGRQEPGSLQTEVSTLELANDRFVIQWQRITDGWHVSTATLTVVVDVVASYPELTTSGIGDTNI